jgi:hypothetical protein
MFEGAWGEKWSDRVLRGFLLDVLGVLGLVRYMKSGDEVPTPLLRRMVALRHVDERRGRYRRKKPTHERRQLAAERKEERTDCG